MSLFAASIHCMDGRIQTAIVSWLKDYFQVPYIDSITEPGPCRILSEDADPAAVASIFKRVSLSVDHHGSRKIAVSGHFDCTANPVSRTEQISQLRICEKRLHERYPGLHIVPLWIDEHGLVEKV